MAIQIPSGLVRAVKERDEAVLFAGAGISYKALGVGGRELRDGIGAEIRKDYPDYDFSTRNLEDVCDEYEVINGRTALVSLLADLIPQNAAPLRSHAAAVNLFRFVITTNWDQLFEEAARRANHRYQILMEESDAPMFNYDQHNLLKIHGSVERPRSFVCTTDDYEGYPDTRPQLMKHVSNLVYNNTVLFVGHALRDEHLRRLLHQVRRERGNFQRPHYVVGFYDAVRTRLLEARGMRVVQADAEEFFDALERAVNE